MKGILMLFGVGPMLVLLVGAGGFDTEAAPASPQAVASPSPTPNEPAGPADSDDKTPRFSETIVVTASSLPRKLDQVTQKVVRIDEEALSAIPVANRNLSELIAAQAGTAVTVLSRNDANWGSYGGLGPKYNAYLLDGLPIDAFVDTMALDPLIFEAIETERGAASVLYGNYLSMDFAGHQTPLAGVTNLVLKRRFERSLTRASLGVGSFRTLTGRIHHQGVGGPFHYLLGASYEDSEYTDYGTTDSWLHMLDNPRYQRTNAYLGTTWRSSGEGHEIGIFLHHAGRDGFSGRVNRDYAHSYDILNLDYRARVSDRLRARAKFGYRGYDRRWGEDNYSPPTSTDLSLRSHDGVRQEIVPADLTLSWRHAGDSLLSAGADFQRGRYQTYSENGPRLIGNQASAVAYGVFAQEELVRNAWTLRLGTRLSRTEHEYERIAGGPPGQADARWDRALWNAGLRYRATDRLSFYSNAGTSFTPASAKSVGGTIPESDRGVAGRHGQLPNPDLSPESGLTTDLGVDLKLGSSLSTGLRGFFTRLDDAIVETRVSLDPSQSRSVNAGDTRAFGLEVDLQGTLSGHWSYFANATWTDTRIQNPLDPDQDGAEVPFVPALTANAGLSYQKARAYSARAWVRRMGPIYDATSLAGRARLPAYTVINASLSKSILTRSAYLADLGIDLINIGNRRYQMPWQFRDPGFQFAVKLDVTFQ